MRKQQYRPSGPLNWFLDHTAVVNWSFLGCLGTEDRSISAWSEFTHNGRLDKTCLLEIHDKPSRFSARSKIKLDERRTEFLGNGGSIAEIERTDLMASHAEIVDIVTRFVENSNGNLVLDITSLPKRFFFPFIKRLLKNTDHTAVPNLIVTYTIPEKYSDQPLAENFNDWAQLPLFGGEYKSDRASMLIIGVGFQALGLQDQIKGEPELPVKLILPFPAPPLAFQRSWELIRQLQKNRNPNAFEIFRASAKDVSDTFDRLASLTDDGRVRAELAPFGPKPMSLGMCIYATITNSEVLYTQPSVYNPDYSTGVLKTNGQSEVISYALRLNGQDYYTL